MPGGGRDDDDEPRAQRSRFQLVPVLMNGLLVRVKPGTEFHMETAGREHVSLTAQGVKFVVDRKILEGTLMQSAEVKLRDGVTALAMPTILGYLMRKVEQERRIADGKIHEVNRRVIELKSFNMTPDQSREIDRVYELTVEEGGRKLGYYVKDGEVLVAICMGSPLRILDHSVFTHEETVDPVLIETIIAYKEAKDKRAVQSKWHGRDLDETFVERVPVGTMFRIVVDELGDQRLDIFEAEDWVNV